jgi:hypothetical protein
MSKDMEEDKKPKNHHLATCCPDPLIKFREEKDQQLRLSSMSFLKNKSAQNTPRLCDHTKTVICRKQYNLINLFQRKSKDIKKNVVLVKELYVQLDRN